jgi:SAM-dependent methyltransferase
VFEQIYRSQEDPWGYMSSAYESSKYRRTLASLEPHPYRRALELGCSIGVFTELLADRCERLVALEPSPTALALARRRVGGRPNVEFVNAAAPEGLPDGSLDLVICSEVLYYLSEHLLLLTLREIEQRLEPGGSLVAVHFLHGQRRRRVPRLIGRRIRGRPVPPSPPAPLSGEAVHEFLRTHTRLSLVREERHERYRLDRFDSA